MKEKIDYCPDCGGLLALDEGGADKAVCRSCGRNFRPRHRAQMVVKKADALVQAKKELEECLVFKSQRGDMVRATNPPYVEKIISREEWKELGRWVVDEQRDNSLRIKELREFIKSVEAQ